MTPQKQRIARCRILVPRLMDAGNLNAQNLNAKAMLARFDDPNFEWHTFYYGAPAPEVRANPRVVLHRLWRKHLWPWHIVMHYLSRYDAVVYPGHEWFDAIGVRWGKFLWRNRPVIATQEGVMGDANVATKLEQLWGHPVYCDDKSAQQIHSFETVRRHADHIIAISPFLQKVASVLFGAGHSCEPLGVERHFFDRAEDAARTKIVVGAGRLAAQKRPEIFLELAAHFPEAQFVWYGDGPLRATLCAKAHQAHLVNLHFPGALPPTELGAAFRAASLFVLPSLSEGVPKVSQEAAASGLPVIIFGFYEAPTVIDGENGFVVWSDDELKARVQTLLDDDALRARMSQAALDLARNWDWDIVAPLWEARIAQELRRRIGTK